MGGYEGLPIATMSNDDCARSIRYQFLSQLQPGDNPQVPLLHRIAADIAEHCGHTLLKAHRLAWGWTVAEAVDNFHQMCRREKIKPRGLVARSWMDWEAGARPNWDYQDLMSRLFHTAPSSSAGPPTTLPQGLPRPEGAALRPGPPLSWAERKGSRS